MCADVQIKVTAAAGIPGLLNRDHVTAFDRMLVEAETIVRWLVNVYEARDAIRVAAFALHERDPKLALAVLRILFESKDIARAAPYAIGGSHPDVIRLYLEPRYAAMRDDDRVMQDTVASGNLGSARLLLDAGVDPDSYGVMQAVSRSGSVDMANLILDSAPRSAPFVTHGTMGIVCGDPTVVIAVQLGHADLVRHLAERFPTVPKSSMLEAAIESKSIEMVRLILDLGADIRRDVIYYAVMENDMSMVKFLLERGASVQPRSVLAAASQGDLEMLRFIFEMHPIGSGDIMKDALCLAAGSGDKAKVRFLLDKGAADVDGDALYRAVLSHEDMDADMVVFLMDNGSDHELVFARGPFQDCIATRIDELTRIVRDRMATRTVVRPRKQPWRLLMRCFAPATRE